MQVILWTEVNIKMNKMNATWAFFLYYFISPLVCMKTGETMVENHQRVWLELNKEEDK